MSQERVIKTGFYKHVSLIEGSVRPVEETKFRLESRIKGILSLFSGRRMSGVSSDLVIVASNVIGPGEIGESDIARLPSSLTPPNLLHMAQIVAMLSFVHDERIQMNRPDINLPYERGLFISDFLEVIPTEVTARILYAASTPDVAEAIYEGRGSLRRLQGHDPQIMAIEGVVLLPSEVRREVFTELARLQPGRSGRARLFLSSMIGNFHDPNSKYGGSKLIYANLQGEEASGKILEVQSEFMDLAEIVNATEPH